MNNFFPSDLLSLGMNAKEAAFFGNIDKFNLSMFMLATVGSCEICEAKSNITQLRPSEVNKTTKNVSLRQLEEGSRIEIKSYGFYNA